MAAGNILRWLYGRMPAHACVYMAPQACEMFLTDAGTETIQRRPPVNPDTAGVHVNSMEKSGD
jgi:hypothetical protein